jgi:hypothetical protein
MVLYLLLFLLSNKMIELRYNIVTFFYLLNSFGSKKN